MTESGAIRLHRILQGQSQDGSVQESPPQARVLDQDFTETVEGVTASNVDNGAPPLNPPSESAPEQEDVFGTPKQHKQRTAEPESLSKGDHPDA